MRSLAMFLLASLAAAQQPQAPAQGALVLGVLLERDAAGASGQFSLRAADSQVFRYLFDPQTYVERDDAVIDVGRLKPGDKIEVVSDQAPGAALRYALTIHVLPAVAPPARPLSLGRYRAYTDSADRLMPSASLSFSGVIFRLSGTQLVLRLRQGAEQAIILRPDTRFLEDGMAVEASSVKSNMRVFVKAGKSLNGEMEAYEVVWGRIMQPE